jgi:hypothetical protein
MRKDNALIVEDVTVTGSSTAQFLAVASFGPFTMKNVKFTNYTFNSADFPGISVLQVPLGCISVSHLATSALSNSTFLLEAI